MEKHIKNVAVFGLASAMVLGLHTSAFAKKEQDGPTMDAVTLYRNVSSPDAEVTVGVDAYDKDEIKRITVYLKNDKNGNILEVELKEKPHSVEIDDRFSGTLKLPSNVPEGLYEVECVVLTDKLNNKSRYFREIDILSGDDVYIIENPPQLLIKRDLNAPDVVGCSVNNSGVRAGSGTYMTLSLSDKVSGIEKASIIFRNPANGRRLYCFMCDEDMFNKGIYRKKLEVPSYEPSGNYELFKITTKDISGNDQAYCNNGEEDSVPLLISEEFNVYSSKGDSISGALESVEIGNYREDPDDDKNIQYKIKVKASDKDSGINHITVRFKNLANDRTVSKVLKSEDYKGSYYSGWMNISKYEPNGTFVLDNVGVTDNANNYQAYCRPEDVSEENHKLSLPRQMSFAYGKGTSYEDEVAPVWQNISVSPKEATVGSGDITVKMNVTDDSSGVDEVRVQFRNHLGKGVNLKLVKAGDSYHGTIKDTSAMESGTYRLTRVILKDKAGNRRAYYKNANGNSSEQLKQNISFALED